MRNLFTKWLAALLAALLLLSPVALMEEVEPASEAPTEVVAISSVDASVEEEDVYLDGDELDHSDEGAILLYEPSESIAEEDELDLPDEDAALLYESSEIITNKFKDAKLLSRVRTALNKGGNEDITVSEAATISFLDLSGLSDLSGLEYLTGLTGYIMIPDFTGTKCVVKNDSITAVAFAGGNKTSISVTGANVTLVNFEMNNEAVTQLDVSGCPKLEILQARGASLTALDVSKNTNLITLDCNSNQITELDLSNNTKLEYVFCQNNKLKTLDLSKTAIASQVAASQIVDGEDEGNVFKALVPTEDWWHVTFDDGVSVLPGHEYNAAPAPAPAPVTAPAPAPAPAPQVITATAKNSRTTVSAAPGTTMQLDLGGKTGKKFKSSNKKVATVDANGNLVIKKAGKVKITFKVGKKKYTKTIIVKDPTIPTSVTLNPVATAVKKGETVTLTPVIPDGTNSAFAWKSSNKKVATVSNGVVTFKKKGKVTITCTAKRGKKKAKITFNVSPQ